MTDIWVCGNCHSINRQRSKNCYKCGSAQSVAATDDGARRKAAAFSGACEGISVLFAIAALFLGVLLGG